MECDICVQSVPKERKTSPAGLELERRRTRELIEKEQQRNFKKLRDAAFSTKNTIIETFQEEDEESAYSNESSTTF